MPAAARGQSAMPAAGELPDYVEPLGDGIFAIDTGFQRPRFDAAYLMLHEGRVAFVDTGTNHGLPRLLGALRSLGVDASAVDWVIPTHVHLDHAGGAGALMRALPGARLLVHPRGARHMVDPSALYAGALAVYGEAEMQRAYGELVPVDAARVVASHDGMRVELGGRPLTLIDTPGHARHHHCLWDEASRSWFTGDTFGIAYPEFQHPDGRRWMLPTTTPVQFDPGALHASIERLLAREPRAMLLTHYGRVDTPRQHAAQLRALLDAMVAIGLAARDDRERDARLRHELAALYARSAREHGFDDEARTRELLALDVELNAQGLADWLDKQGDGAAPG